MTQTGRADKYVDGAALIQSRFNVLLPGASGNERSFVEPDFEALIAQSAGQFFDLRFIAAMMAQKNIVIVGHG